MSKFFMNESSMDDDDFREITDADLDNDPFWQGLFEILQKEENREKMFVKNKIRYKEACEIYRKISYLLKQNGMDYTLSMRKPDGDLFKTDLVIEFVVKYSFGTPRNNIQVFKDVINGIDGIDFYVRLDEKLVVLFALKDVFIEW